MKLETSKEIEEYKRLDYSLEDSLNFIANGVDYLTRKQISKMLLRCFCEFVCNKNKIFDEIEQELISKNIDEKTIKYIKEKLDSVIFSNYYEEY